ncbi:capsular polysaccharide biosynthesis protein [Polynucleobacter sphagniphilus]|uniref:capsular polysaccharide biosynthesis protein n=1 Tax=Polynucleobacter sphagniphilus TaxID=1743169 RepID=UPI002473C3CC|nr:capsular polysaccharide biosynthesis protein [Polynucleobacter sphagniphilus]MDH6299944.1 capsular polysaccharide export protein [Polynucleobacter sphagniphilus]
MSVGNQLSQFNSSPEADHSQLQPHYGITSWGLFHEYLEPFFKGATLVNPLISRAGSSIDAVLAWGNKPSSKRATTLAQERNVPLIRLEDGFLYGLEPRTSARSSLVIDDLGIYYDANQPSRLEHCIGDDLTESQILRARSIQALWQMNGVSKYNHAPDWIRPSDEWSQEPFILLVDQTRGDQSIAGAMADANSFELMLNTALAQSTFQHILIKVHPEVMSGKKLGHFDVSATSALRSHPRIRILDQDCNLSSVIKEANAVFTVSSQAGFEGMLWGKPVHTFGIPFYAGWGLTFDFLLKPSRRGSASLEQLIYSTLVSYSRYIHPETGNQCQIEDLIEYYGFQKMQHQRFKQALYSNELSINKRRHLKRFIQGCALIADSQSFSQNDALLLWGSRPTPMIDSKKAQKVIRLEDGFIRSIGLGAALSTPFSWVFDQTGIYYDSSRPSDLERILQNGKFDDALTDRAEVLRQKIISLGISKYNLGRSQDRNVSLRILRQARQEKRALPFLLVIGQVESDASIQFGGVDIRTNSDLLKAVRSANPSAFIVYKPHPDVEHALRFKGSNDQLDPSIYDLLLSDSNLTDCLDLIDEVHTISSLAGFEALLREKPVVCYGLPFYAGWGLTVDRYACERRTRKLTITELIAGALILYPTYVHPKSGLYCTPEALIEALYEQMQTSKNPLKHLLHISVNFVKKKTMGFIHRLKGI